MPSTKSLQGLVRAGQLRRIDRGLYDTPRLNKLTKRPAVADYRQIIDALARRDQVRVLVDGLTAANNLGLTTAVPAHVVIHTDARRRTIRLDNLAIEFKQTARSKLYWAGRPAMRWLKDTLATDRDRILARLSQILMDRRYGKTLRDDLRAVRCPRGRRLSSANYSMRIQLAPSHQPVVSVPVAPRQAKGRPSAAHA